MNRNSKYRKTLTACYLGFITQAIAANFAPLLFLTFHRTFQISLGKIALISTVFFFTQLLVDLFCAKYVDRIGYRRSVVVSEILSASGLIGLALLPNLLPDPYAGILISVMIYAIGSGLIEVLVSPIVEACPFDNKDKVMSLLHSFYCWGSVGVILLSTLFFAVFGIESWRILACIWALIPLYNTFNFLSCPIEMLTENGEGLSIRQLFTIPLFWVALVLMVCAGASEISMAQWASWHFQKSRRYRRALPVCGYDGNQPFLLWEIRRQTGSHEIHDLLRRTVSGLLSALRSGSVPASESSRLHCLRLLRWNYVAGHHQHCLR